MIKVIETNSHERAMIVDALLYTKNHVDGLQDSSGWPLDPIEQQMLKNEIQSLIDKIADINNHASGGIYVNGEKA